MVPKYSSISLEAASKMYGISSMFVAPREWCNPWDVDFKTNTVINTITLLPDKVWMQLFFAPKSYKYNDDTKIVKGGSYFEVKASGIINHLTPDVAQVLNTLRYHELVVVMMDMNKQQRVVGDVYAGMIFTTANETSNADSGTQNITVNLQMDSEEPPLFYSGTPPLSIQIGYYLQDGSGALLDDGIGDKILIK